MQLSYKCRHLATAAYLKTHVFIKWHINIVMCRVVSVTKITGSRLDDWIY
jgi:hypothetical protein